MNDLSSISLRALAFAVALITSLWLARSPASAQDGSLEITIRVRAAAPDVDAIDGDEDGGPSGLAPDRLRLVVPEHAPDFGPNVLHPASPDLDAGPALVTGGLVLALSTIGIAIVAGALPTFGEQWPDWAAVTLGLSLPLSAAALLALGVGAGVAAGATESEMIAVAGGVELALATFMGAVGIAIAPGIGAAWGDPLAQARASEMLGLGALSFGVMGLVGILLGGLDEPPADPTRSVALAPVATPTTAGVQLGGHF